MNPSGTGDSVAPRGAELVVVGGLHDRKVGKGGIEWLRGSLDVTLEAQQAPVDDYSTLLSRYSHDNTRFCLRSLTNIP